MSIYGTVLSLDLEHEEGCAFWVEESEGVFEAGDPSDCTCQQPGAPTVYEGSHIMPSDEDRRGGCVEVAYISNHVERADRPDLPYGSRKDWLRLGVDSVDSETTMPGGGEEPYVRGGSATVLLNRPQVERLRDTLTGWLERPEGE